MPDLIYPAELEITQLTKTPSATVTVPGSKSITNRALILAALNSSGLEVYNALRSEDTEVMVECLRRLGFGGDTNWDRKEIQVHRLIEFDHVPEGEWIPNHQAELFVGNSGTTVRFITAMLALGNGRYRLDGVARMRERPIQDLLDALQQMGVDARSEFDNGCPPVIINANGLRGGHVKIKADVSSQFLSALLLVCPFASGDTLIEVDGPLVSEPYVEMTLDMLQTFGLKITVPEAGRYLIPGHQSYGLCGYTVEADASSASYFLAAAAITGGTVGVEGLTTKSIQGDVRFLDILEDMGCTAYRGHDSIAITGGTLRGVDVDMNDISDTVMTLAAVACFAEGPTTIRNVAHIRHKETDRIAALATELRKLGAEVEERADGLTITPRTLKGCAVDTYNDHRMAMSLALIGLRVPGVVIRNPGCVAKTYPGFWQDLEKLRD
jgi:3-phosphoshikimate 1-carboxyvinyltransferase